LRITIPSTITRIEESAFADCTEVINSTGNLTLSYIGKRAFNDCPLVISLVDLEASTQTVLDDQVFNGCKLSNIILPKTLTSIGTNTLNVSGNLTSVVFNNTKALTNISTQIKSSNIYLASSVLTTNFDKLWATTSYYLYNSGNNIGYGPNGIQNPDGKIIPTTLAGMMLRSQIISDTTAYAIVQIKQSFPDIYNGYTDIPELTNNVTIYPGFKIMCTQVGTDNPNDNNNQYIQIPGNEIYSNIGLIVDNTSGAVNKFATISNSLPNILLFYGDVLIKVMS